MRCHTVALAVALSTAAVGFAGAQDAPRDTGYEETVDVRLSILDVVVVDRKGRPLTGLTRDDFEVRVDRKRREIASIDAWRGGEASPPTTVEPLGGKPASSERPVPAWGFIVFDVDHLSPQYRGRAMEVARRIVSEAAGSGGRMAAGRLAGGELRMLVPFQPAGEIKPSSLSDPDRLLGLTDPMSSRIEQAIDAVYACTEAPDPENCILTNTAEFREMVERENRNALRALRHLVTAMSPIPGRKALFLLSDGMLLDPGEVIAEAVRHAGRGPERILSLLSVEAPRDYNALIAEASAASVSVFALRTGTPVESFSGTVRRTPDARRAATERQRDAIRLAGRMMESSLVGAARRTGGEAVLRPLDERSTSGLWNQLAGVYSLGIPIEPDDRLDSRVRVRLVGVEGNVRAPDRLTPGAAVPRALSGRLELSPAVENGQRPRIDAKLRLDIAALTREKGPNESGIGTSRVAVYVRLLDTSGRQLAQHYTMLAVPRQPGEAQEFVHPLTLMVEPGTFVVEAAATDILGRGLARFSERIAIPPATRAPGQTAPASRSP